MKPVSVRALFKKKQKQEKKKKKKKKKKTIVIRVSTPCHHF